MFFGLIPQCLHNMFEISGAQHNEQIIHDSHDIIITITVLSDQARPLSV